MSARKEPSRSPLGWGHAFDDRLEDIVDADALARAGEDGGHPRGWPITSSISRRTSSTSALARSILLTDRDHLEVIVDRLVHVGERLRLDALRRIDDPATLPRRRQADRDTS